MTKLPVQENKANLNLYAPNNTASKPIKQNLTELKGTRETFTMTVANF